jgi:hypothetical protein
MLNMGYITLLRNKNKIPQPALGSGIPQQISPENSCALFKMKNEKTGGHNSLLPLNAEN